ncbi:MAG: hypothetical protein ACI9YE_001479 [Psychroserpens sp.]|jgi:hypothetical protein
MKYNIQKNLPNFLIVGAAKSGTTSLHAYLSGHQDILMSTPKEPKYFSNRANDISFSGKGDIGVYSSIVKSKTEYKNLFKSEREFIIKGESSADTLYYYKKVIPLIQKELKEPYILILLRNPIQRAFSAYTHLIRDEREISSFEEGLLLESERKKLGYEFIWYYKEVGLYYNQVKSYIENFKNCKVILFDDLNKDSQLVVDDTCDFLKLTKIKINKDKVYNKSGIPRRNLQTFLYKKFIKKRSLLRKIASMFLKETKKEQIALVLKEQLFNKQLQKAEMKPETKQQLIDYFKEDILKLEKLIDRDLQHWLK